MKTCYQISERSLRVLIAYEDFTTGQRAMRLCQRLIDKLGQHFQFRTCLWKFDILRTPRLRAIAAQDASEADLLIISTHFGGELPREVRGWMTAWPVKDPRRPQALVGLLYGTNEQTEIDSPAQAFLQEFARQGRFAFFCHILPLTSALENLPGFGVPLGQPNSPLLDEILRQGREGYL